MKTLYLDIFSGISGDMFLGAMIDLGVDPAALEHELRKLSLDGYHLHTTRGQKALISGIKFDVHLHEHGHDHGHTHAEPHHHHSHEHHHGAETHTHEHSHSAEPSHEHEHGHEHGHSHEDHHHGHAHEHDEGHAHNRGFAEIKELISRAGLSDWVREKSIKVFERIAVAEGRIHGLPPDEVHFHEVGAVDSIVDIVGACLALEMLGKPRVLSAPVVEGTGWINCAHGRFPIPAPATLQILAERGIAVTQCDEPRELVTPTGAALLAEFVVEFGPMRGLAAEKIGIGLGTRDNQTRPNVLRAILGRTGAPAHDSGRDWETDTIAVLETNLDDISAEILGHFVEKALAAGALDVFHTPVQMKKNRPGVLLTILCVEGDADKFSELVLRETTAFGVRRTLAERRKLRRELVTVETPYGNVIIKFGRLNGAIVQAAPEYESCKKLAEAANVPVKAIFEAARQSVATLR